MANAPRPSLLEADIAATSVVADRPVARCGDSRVDVGLVQEERGDAMLERLVDEPQEDSARLTLCAQGYR